jgi:rhodanese-related sulfurtransferase
MNHLSEFIVRHWQLATASVVMLIIIFIYEYIVSQKQAKLLSTEQAIDHINNHEAIVIDIRSAELYKQGHIIHSIRSSGADFKLPKMQRYKDKPVILVCTRGIESNLLATKLPQQGFTRVMILAGGISAWQTANLPLVKK